MLKSSRPLHWLRLLLGPMPKIPAWSISKGVWKPLSATMGMSGRAFSRRTPDLRRLDQRPPRGDLGAVGQRDRHQVVEAPAGVDQRDLGVVVLQRLDHRAGVEPQHPRQPGALDPPLLPRRDRLLLEVGEHVPGPVDLERPGPGRGSGRRSARPRRGRGRRCRGRRRRSRGTGAPGSRRRRSAAGRRSSPSGCPSAGRSGPAGPPGAGRWRRSWG